jgi:hypothetical protein
MRCRGLSIRCMLFVSALSLCPGAVQAQFFFESDALYWQRNNQANANFVTGPQTVTAGGGDYDFQPGYRLRLGGEMIGMQVDGSFTQIGNWSTASSGTFARPVVFDDTANNAFVVGAVPGNTLVFPGFLREASLSTAAGADESTEGELLKAGAIYSTLQTSTLSDIDVNFGTSHAIRPWRVAVGYRHIQLGEKDRVQMGGVFDAIDVANGAVFGQVGNSPNDGLSNGAITGAGGSLVSGTGDGYDAFNAPGGPDSLVYQVYSRSMNQLSGAQLVFGYRLVNRDWIKVESYAKTGVFQNKVGGMVQELLAGGGNDNSVYARTLLANAKTISFAGNLGVRALIGVTDYIDIIVGYEIFYLSNVALGADQLNGVTVSSAGVTSYSPQMHGSLFANGGTLGLQVVW